MKHVDEFKQPNGNTPRGIPLTDAEGTVLTQDTDAPAFYKQAASGAETLSFFVDPDGSRYVRINDINVTADTEVALTVALKWKVLGANKEKYAYAMSLTGAQALGGINTAYPLIEDVPPGTIQVIEVATAGACTVAVNVMGRYA